MSKKALLLVGSPKGFRSASGSLGSYLMRQLAARGWETSQVWLRPSWENPLELTEAVAAADLVVLSAPLYVDGPPGPVVRAMELLAGARGQQAAALAGGRAQGGDAPHPGAAGAAGGSGRPASPRPAFVAMTQSGFPEADQSNTALAIYRRFAAEAGFTWAGGLALGAGPIVRSDRPLEEAGDLLQTPRQALDMAADGLAAGQSVPPAAVKLMAQTLVPPGLYRAMGQKPWVKAAAKNGISLRQMFARPYEPDRLRRAVDLTDLSQLVVTANTAEVVTWQGRPALRLDGLALLKDLEISEGVLELDLGVEPGGCYPGLTFHVADPDNRELIYCQPHTSGQWDALQYDPVFHGVNTWQIYGGPDYQGAADVPSGRWITLRVEFTRHSATARIRQEGGPMGERVDGPAPLTVHQLAQPQTTGRIGVWTYHPAYFAALRIYAPKRGQGLAGPSQATSAPGAVTAWHLEGHGPVTAEPNGTLCLNRYIRQAKQSQAVLRHEFESTQGGEVELAFGFSDTLKLLLDDQELFAGEHRFAGFADRMARGYIEGNAHVVPVVLSPGRHTLTAVLTAQEPFGWGLNLAIRGAGGE